MSVLDDLRYALRGFARSKVAAAILLVSLALGTGANAVLYSAMDALLFRPPAGLSDASRLVSVFTSQYNGSANGASSYPDFQSLETAGSFAMLAAFDDSAVEAVRLGDTTQRVRVAAVSDGFFSTLELSPHEGRLLAADVNGSDPPPAVISYALWTMFGSPGGVIGQRLRIGGAEYTIAGIAPLRFDGLQLGRQCHVWRPLAAAERERGRGVRRLSIVGRLARGATLDRAQDEVDENSRRRSPIVSPKRIAGRSPTPTFRG